MESERRESGPESEELEEEDQVCCELDCQDQLGHSGTGLVLEHQVDQQGDCEVGVVLDQTAEGGDVLVGYRENVTQLRTRRVSTTLGMFQPPPSYWFIGRIDYR